MRYFKRFIPWYITVYIIWPYLCKREKHFIATVLDKKGKPDYKWCMYCDVKFSLDYISKR